MDRTQCATLRRSSPRANPNARQRSPQTNYVICWRSCRPMTIASATISSTRSRCSSPPGRGARSCWASCGRTSMRTPGQSRALARLCGSKARSGNDSTTPRPKPARGPCRSPAASRSTCFASGRICRSWRASGDLPVTCGHAARPEQLRQAVAHCPRRAWCARRDDALLPQGGSHAD